MCDVGANTQIKDMGWRSYDIGIAQICCWSINFAQIYGRILLILRILAYNNSKNELITCLQANEILGNASLRDVLGRVVYQFMDNQKTRFRGLFEKIKNRFNLQCTNFEDFQSSLAHKFVDISSAQTYADHLVLQAGT